MSHVINYNSIDADHHGRNFASTYLKVVRQFIGLKSYRELLESFRKNKVKFRRKRNVKYYAISHSDERRGQGKL